VADLNALYRRVPALHASDFDSQGFAWLPFPQYEPTVLAWMRTCPEDEGTFVAAVHNMTPQPRHGLRIGLPCAGVWHELLNSDAAGYGGSGVGNLGRVEAVHEPLGDRPASASITVPPLATLILSNRHPSSFQQGVVHARP
jgi:1,4-alpha-glucan branching enzyme